MKHDTKKAPLAMLLDCPRILEETAKVLEFGAKKYDRCNWSKCDNPERYTSALLRHVSAWHNGEDCDQETGLSHLAHAMCCLMFLAEINLTKEENNG